MNVTVQEQEEPAEDPKELIGELEESLKFLEKLMADINRTNCLMKTEKGTLTELIVNCQKRSLEDYSYLIISFVFRRQCVLFYRRMQCRFLLWR